MIRFEQASVTYGGGVHALEGVDLEIADGEFVVVVGLSGAGKSTLVRAVNGLVPLTSGRLEVNGVDVTGLSPRQMRNLRADMGMIFQSFNLVNRTTVLNNVLMGRLHRVPTWRTLLGWYPRDDVEIAMQSLERVEIVEKAYVRASNLSGGQRQRVGIARALAQQPRVILADEPVASLDPPTSHVVMRDLQRINRELGDHDDRQPALPRSGHLLRRSHHRTARRRAGVRRVGQRSGRHGVREHLRPQPDGRRHDGEGSGRPVRAQHDDRRR